MMIIIIASGIISAGGTVGMIGADDSYVGEPPTKHAMRDWSNYLNSFRPISPPGPPNSACLWNASSTNRGLRL